VVSRGAETLAADAATQIDESRAARRGRNAAPPEQEAARLELGIDEISPPPPPSSSSPETLFEHDAHIAAANASAVHPRSAYHNSSRTTSQ
jgi:hypothetical protein